MTTTPHWGLGSYNVAALLAEQLGARAARKTPALALSDMAKVSTRKLQGVTYVIYRGKGYVLVQEYQGSQMTNHWFEMPYGNTFKGVGDVPPDVYTAAQAVVAYFQAAPCAQTPISVVSDFQTAYNASGMPGSLTVDGEYGGNTQRALQNALNTAPAVAGGGAAQQAPPNCYGGVVVNGENYGNVPDVPAPDAPNAAPVVPANPPSADTPSTAPNYTPYYIGAAALLGAAGIYFAYKKRKK